MISILTSAQYRPASHPTMWMIGRLGLITLLFCVCSLSSVAECLDVSPATAAKLTRYIATNFFLGDATDLELGNTDLVHGGCYRRITVLAPEKGSSITVYLSPDHRYISSALVDLNSDPATVREEELERISSRLMSDPSPRRGSDDAPVNIVEFGDFECPYCKEFEDRLAALPREQRRTVRLVYKFMPLSMHPWAAEAARVSACAFLQSERRFWQLHDFYLQHQTQITSASLLSLSMKVLGENTDAVAINRCLDTMRPQNIIKTDQRLAAELNIHGTPAVFINGRLAVVSTQEALASAIDEALNIKRVNTPSVRAGDISSYHPHVP